MNVILLQTSLLALKITKDSYIEKATGHQVFTKVIAAAIEVTAAAIVVIVVVIVVQVAVIIVIAADPAVTLPTGIIHICFF